MNYSFRIAAFFCVLLTGNSLASDVRKKCTSSIFQEPLLLIADDDAQLRNLFGQIAATLGVKVIKVSTGMEALKTVAQGTIPDVLLTDFSMPELNGLELVQELRMQGINIPIILVSGHNFEFTADEDLPPGRFFKADHATAKISNETFFRLQPLTIGTKPISVAQIIFHLKDAFKHAAKTLR